MRYLLLSVLVVCVIGIMVPSAFAEESFHKKIIFDPSASAQVAELDEINNRLYVLSENTKEKPYTSEIMIIDTSQNSFDVIDAIHFDSLVDFTISKSTNKIYVAPWGSVYISVIDGTTLKEIDRIYPDYATKDCDNSVNWCDPVTKEYGIFSHFNNLIINETTQELFAYSHVFKKILVIDLDTKEYVNYFTAINPDMIGIDEERNLLYYYDKPSTPGKSGLKDSALNGITQNEACLNTTTYFWCTPSNLQKKYSISDKYCTHCFWDFTFDKKNDLIYVRLSDRQNPNEFVVFNLKNDHTGISITNNLLFENPKPIILEDKNLMLFMQLSGGIGHKLHGIIVLDVKNITTGEYEIVKHIDQTDEQLERFLAYDEKNGRLYGKTADAIIAYDIDKLLSSEEVSEEELTQSLRLQNCWSQYNDALSNLAKQSMQGNLDFLAFNNAKRDLSNHYTELCSQYVPEIESEPMITSQPAEEKKGGNVGEDGLWLPSGGKCEGKILNGVCVVEEKKGGGCLIATAAFGSEMAPQVQFLREIRDNTVLQTESGTSFMTGFNQFYYSFSPYIADYERENPAFKETVKLALTPLLTSLTLLQYADIDSESEMLGYGIGIILLNIGMYFVAPAVLIMTVRKRI